MEKVKKSEQEWRQELTPEQYEVVRNKGTEAPFTSELNDVKEAGEFVCVACGQPAVQLGEQVRFRHRMAELRRPKGEGSVETEADNGFLMRRTEVLCSRCDAHLGHVFDDGPADTTGQRYCINGCALEFKPETTRLNG